jgi:4-amino-4-deoxy-L-arabinose transferase-like glycosyltransferase
MENVRAHEKVSMAARLVRWVENRSSTQIFISLYLIALCFRLVILWLTAMHTPLESDAKIYFDKAVLLAKGDGYVRFWPDGVFRPTANHVPGTTLFLTMGVLLFGKHEIAGRLMAILISSFSAPLLYRFALNIEGAFPAVLAGLCGALYPTWAFYSVNTLSEPFLMPLLLLALIVTHKAFESSAWGIAFGAGLAWGAATLVRPVVVPMTGLVALYFVSRGKWKGGFVLGLGFLAMLSPWLVRNYMVFGRLLLANQGGEVLLGSNNPYILATPKNYGMWIAPREVPEYREKLEGVRDEITENTIEKQLAMDYLRQNRKDIPRLVYYKLERWLTPITETGGSVRILVLGSYGVLLVLLFVGLFRGVYRSSIDLHLVLLWTLVLIGITIVYWGILTRGRLLLELVWLPWACLTAWDIVKRVLRLDSAAGVR